MAELEIVTTPSFDQLITVVVPVPHAVPSFLLSGIRAVLYFMVCPDTVLLVTSTVDADEPVIFSFKDKSRDAGVS